MFSGIIEEFATVVAIEKDRDNIDFTLRCSFVDELGIDQSVAHNGVCLTVVKIENGTYTVTAMKETLERTNLGLLKNSPLYMGFLRMRFTVVSLYSMPWASLTASMQRCRLYVVRKVL